MKKINSLLVVIIGEFSSSKEKKKHVQAKAFNQDSGHIKNNLSARAQALNAIDAK